MRFANLGQLARKHLISSVTEEVYLRSGVDRTRPTAIHAMVTYRCNSRCRYCAFWSDAKYESQDEMSIEQWKAALASLKEFIGGFFVELSGGEPLMKEDFIELPRFCHASGISWGITTNGLGLNEQRAEQLVACRPFNTNLSVEATDPKIHDDLRGISGAFARTVRAIDLLRKEREAQGANFPIIVKPTVNVRNFQRLPDLVRWAKDRGAVVNLQPLERWTDDTNGLWINADRERDLQAVVAELLVMKARGAPILNSEKVLNLLPAHFRGETAPREVLPCRIGMRNFFIRPNGDVTLCFNFKPIGNMKTQTAREVWYGADAKQRRRETVACERLCLYTCLSGKTLRDKTRMAFQLLRNRGR